MSDIERELIAELSIDRRRTAVDSGVLERRPLELLRLRIEHATVTIRPLWGVALPA